MKYVFVNKGYDVVCTGIVLLTSFFFFTSLHFFSILFLRVKKALHSGPNTGVKDYAMFPPP